MQDWAAARDRFEVVESAKALVADYRKETQSNAGRHYRDYSDPEFERVYKSHFAKLQRMREEAERRGTLVEELETVGSGRTALLDGRAEWKNY